MKVLWKFCEKMGSLANVDVDFHGFSSGSYKLTTERRSIVLL